MKRPSVHDIVFDRQYPKPKQNEPQNFYAHVQRNLVPEVRVEVQTFYGALDSLEAQYPGLDYTYEPHRRRLSRFQWHRRLFRIFDELNLTSDEILSICQWEGTKSAKDKYEAETGRKIRDTTADGVVIAARTEPQAIVHSKLQPVRKTLSETMARGEALDGPFSEAADQSDEDEIEASVGIQLNQQLMREADGDSAHDGPLEEWWKYVHERDADRDSVLQAIRAGHPPPTVLEHIRARAAAAAGASAVATAPSNVVPPFPRSNSHHSYGPTNEEVLAALESRVQA